MPYKTVRISDMRAVGMHHWGDYKLVVGAQYTVQWEPECPHDPGNAMAIYDQRKVKRAYITRRDASILSHIWVKDIIINDLMLCIPETNAHLSITNLGHSMSA